MNNKVALVYIVNICRITVGILFIFSGFVKGVDPLGTTYKLIDYFDAFHIGFLNPLALPFSILLNMSEFILGIALLMGVFKNFFVWMAIIYMGIFTPLTFVLAIYNPVTDCGCFGDAIIMTNWQTFFKNLVIIIVLLPVFIYRKSIQSPLKVMQQWILLLISSVVFLSMSAYTYRHLPFIDFRPYKLGTHIPNGMQILEGMPVDSFRYSVVYQKEEIIKEFSLENMPTDTAWKWVETKTTLIKKGYHPPIHDFLFTSLQGENVTDSILYDTSYVFLAVSYKLDKSSADGLLGLKRIYEHSRGHKVKFYLATASTTEHINKYREEFSLPFLFYTADDIMLKTIVRANPGLVLIKNGIVINKWHYNDFPSDEELSAIYSKRIKDRNEKLGGL